MKKWLKFFFLGFFSHKRAKEGARRDGSNAFLSFVLALIFLWSGFYCADMLPFGAHYGSSPDFKAAVYAVFANADAEKRVEAEIGNGALKIKKRSGEFSKQLFVNTLENDADRQNYSVNGYAVVVDTRPADALAEVEAYCVSNDGKDTVISYGEYLSLSEVARMNFDFKLRYTGSELSLTDEAVYSYAEYINGLGGEPRSEADSLKTELAENKISKEEYRRAIYALYFKNYYPEISEYESSSEIPLLRNYYYHQYISKGLDKFIFIFDDYMTGSFETQKGIDVSFYGFYSDMENGVLIESGAEQADAEKSVDCFIKDAFGTAGILNAYAYALNVISLAPIVALMLLAVALLVYSMLKLRGIESVASYGAALKTVGAFSWASGAISALVSIAISFVFGRGAVGLLPLTIFFAALAVRSLIFAVKEGVIYMKQTEGRESEKTEV